MGPYIQYAGVNYNPTLWRLQSQLQNMYDGHRATLGQSRPYNTMPETTLSPARDQEFGLRIGSSSNLGLSKGRVPSEETGQRIAPEMIL